MANPAVNPTEPIVPAVNPTEPIVPNGAPPVILPTAPAGAIPPSPIVPAAEDKSAAILAAIQEMQAKQGSTDIGKAVQEALGPIIKALTPEPAAEVSPAEAAIAEVLAARMATLTDAQKTVVTSAGDDPVAQFRMLGALSAAGMISVSATPSTSPPIVGARPPAAVAPLGSKPTSMKEANTSLHQALSRKLAL